MATKSLRFEAPPSLAIAEGATTPNPGIEGVSVWSSTLAKPVYWTGSQWTAGASGGGGGASWQRVVLNVPAGQARFKKVNLAAAAVTPASVVACQFFGGTGAAVNEADEVANWTITATPLAGSINFNLSCPGPFVGAVEILYQVQ